MFSHILPPLFSRWHRFTLQTLSMRSLPTLPQPRTRTRGGCDDCRFCDGVQPPVVLWNVLHDARRLVGMGGTGNPRWQQDCPCHMISSLVRSLPLAILLVLSPLHGAPAESASTPSPRECQSLNSGWRFQKGDPAEVQGSLDYQKIKAWILPSGRFLREFWG